MVKGFWQRRRRCEPGRPIVVVRVEEWPALYTITRGVVSAWVWSVKQGGGKEPGICFVGARGPGTREELGEI